jgi:xanthine/uracil permease
MGLNAYFAYQIVGFHGGGLIPYRLALTAVFVEGFIFIFLSLIGMRQWLVKTIPASLKIASACGIGLFLSEIGLSYSAGIGAITGGSSQPLNIAGCPSEYIVDGVCQSHKMTSPTVSKVPLVLAKMRLHVSCMPTLTGRSPDVDWHLLRRDRHRVSHDFQSEECHDRRHRAGIDHVLAVSGVLDLGFG